MYVQVDIFLLKIENLELSGRNRNKCVICPFLPWTQLAVSPRHGPVPLWHWASGLQMYWQKP